MKYASTSIYPIGYIIIPIPKPINTLVISCKRNVVTSLDRVSAIVFALLLIIMLLVSIKEIDYL